MIPALLTDRAVLLNGDSSELDLGEHTVDAIVTDPPAGIGFMGKDWDGDKGGREQWIAWLAQTLAPAFRALKPGGHALVWAIPRTSHWTATALELVGFEIRDVVMHLFGTGFPKSRNVSIDIDKMLGGERQSAPVDKNQTCVHLKAGQPCEGHGDERSQSGLTYHKPPTSAGSPEAKAWEGWGTALKPACEHWILARKPLTGTLAANVLAHGTGVINVDGCRIGDEIRVNPPAGNKANPDGSYMMSVHGMPQDAQPREATGRWPAHLVLDEEAAALLDEQSGTSKSPTKVTRGGSRSQAFGMARQDDVPCSGGASRFFYVAKPTRKERDAGLDHLPARSGGEATGRVDGGRVGTQNPRAGAGRTGGARNHHPTVKSIALMRWLVRLITPPGGVVLDPFCGSGSTGVAALAEGAHFIGVEQSSEYCEIAKGRLVHALGETP